MIHGNEQAKRIRDEVVKQLSQNKFEEGTKLLEENKANLPKKVWLECVGTSHFYRRDYQVAIQFYEEAIALDPDYLIARYQYLVGVKNDRQENFVEAFKRYQAAIGIEPAFVDAYVNLGGLLTKVGDFEGAAQCYRDAIKHEPDDVANIYNLKTVLELLSKSDPQGYRSELQDVEAIYLRLQADAPTPSVARAW